MTQQTAYPSVIPYLLVADAPHLIAFFEAGFGAVMRMSVPAPDGRVMHAEITLGDSVIMISDAVKEPAAPAHLCHYVADVDAAYEKALAAGAVSVSPPETKDYGDRLAGIKDPAGNTWWICAPA
jgi:uncharacterized glyoxalase superfamily protein PhnB